MNRLLGELRMLLLLFPPDGLLLAYVRMGTALAGLA